MSHTGGEVVAQNGLDDMHGVPKERKWKRREEPTRRGNALGVLDVLRVLRRMMTAMDFKAFTVEHVGVVEERQPGRSLLQLSSDGSGGRQLGLIGHWRIE